MAWKRKGGGGFLNGETGKITSADLEATKFEGGRDGSYHKVSMKLTIERDGGAEVDQYLDLGFLPDGGKISKDKKAVICDNDAPFREDTAGIRFISSAIEAGFPESDIEEGEGKRFDMLEGKRYEFRKEPDREQQIKIGKSRLNKKGKKNPTEDECFEAGKREGTGEHKGKKFDLDVLLVARVLDDEAPSKGSGKKATNGSGKATKAREEEPEETSGDLDDDRKDEVLREVLSEAKDGTLPRGRLSGAITVWAAENNVERAERDALREALYDEDYLAEAAERGVITYDADDKKQPITLAAKKGKKR